MLGEYFKKSVAWHAACGRHAEPQQSVKNFLKEYGHLRLFFLFSPPWGVFDEEHDVALTDAQIKVRLPPPRHSPRMRMHTT